MTTRLLLVLVLGMFLRPGFGQQPYWQQQVNFDMDVSLNDSEHTLDGYAKITYINRSPDTLRYIWFHLWPNAFKNDRTAFSDQLLQNGRTDFYFSDAEQRGYINRLDFKVNNVTATVKDHPLHQDIVQVLLPQPLPPGATAQIATPFHVKLPQNFSRGGHVGQAYQITQWYPKPAMYDRNGWHPMPYLDQGEFYNNFGNYRVQITLPANYIVAATGQLMNPSAALPILAAPPAAAPSSQKKKATGFAPPKKASTFPASDSRSVTYLFEQENVHDFAWFADKRFVVQTDTVRLPSGRVVRMQVYHLPDPKGIWKNSLSMIRKTLLTRGQWLGEYPYQTVSVAETPMGFSGGMEYPTITSIAPVDGESELEELIEHEVGHNWNQGILASNERQHPWIDEGFNSYYDRRYNRLYRAAEPQKGFGTQMKPADMDELIVRTLYAESADQPIATPAEAFTVLNSNFIAYTKAALWLEQLEALLGQPLLDQCMQTFYQRWQFKHPQPEDFKAVVEEVSGRNLDGHFALLNRKGPMDSVHRKKSLRLTPLLSLRQTDRHQFIGITPLVGFNRYDKMMVGALIHNYTLPLPRLRFVVAPLYATGSKELSGIGRLSYTHRWGNKGQYAELGVSGIRFTGDDFVDSTGTRNFLRFTRLAPSLKIDFGRRTPRSTVRKYLLLRSFLIGETQLRFARNPVTLQETISYPVVNRYVNQVRFVAENDRALYPWRGEWQVEQGRDFVRAAFTGNYHFNYNAKGGGLDVRVFAGKFFYLGDRTFAKQFATDIYHLNLTGPKGHEDYTYSNYFVGRNEFEGFASQQIMMRDGGFKVRTDLLSSKIGKTDNWLAAVNLVSTIPAGLNPLEILPIPIPLRVFVDIGTFAEAWQKGATTGRFVYDAGLQVSLLRNTVHIYFPLLYSKVYRDYFRSTIPDKRFVRNIAFSIDIQHLRLKKILGPSWL